MKSPLRYIEYYPGGWGIIDHKTKNRIPNTPMYPTQESAKTALYTMRLKTDISDTKTCRHTDQSLDFDKVTSAWFWHCNICGKDTPTTCTAEKFLKGEYD